LAVAGLINPKAYQYRFNDEPASGLVLNGDTERQIGAVILEKQVFTRIEQANRLRLQVTAVKLENFDIDVSDVPKVEKEFQSLGCSM